MPARSIDKALKNGSLDAASRVFKFSLSTIRSPVFSQVTVLHRGIDFHAIAHRYPSAGTVFGCISPSQEAEEASQHRKRFQLLREIRKARNFRLVLHANVQETVGEYVVRMLEEAVAAEKASRGFNTLFPKPSVTHTFFQIEPPMW